MRKKIITCCLLMAMAPNLLFGTPASASINTSKQQSNAVFASNNLYGDELEFDEALYYGASSNARSTTKNYYKSKVSSKWTTVIEVFCKVVDTVSNVISKFMDKKSSVSTNPNSNLVGYGYQTVGGNVSQVQKLLNQNGYSLAEDGVWGSKTYNAVVNFQRSKGLVADGIVGYNTWKALYGN